MGLLRRKIINPFADELLFIFPETLWEKSKIVDRVTKRCYRTIQWLSRILCFRSYMVYYVNNNCSTMFRRKESHVSFIFSSENFGPHTHHIYVHAGSRNRRFRIRHECSQRHCCGDGVGNRWRKRDVVLPCRVRGGVISYLR